MMNARIRSKNQKNTLLVRLALWAAAVALLSVMTVGMISYSNLEQEIQENARFYYQQRFDYMCNLLEDQAFMPVVKIFQEAIILDDWKSGMRALSGTLVTQNEITEMNELLGKKTQVNSLIADVALYSPGNGFLVSGRSGVRFLNNAAQSTPFDVGWIEEIQGMNKSNSVRWILQRAYPENLGVEGDVVSMVYYNSYGAKKTGEIYLCLSISVQEMLERVELRGEELLFMVDGQGNSALGERTLPEELAGRSGTVSSGTSVYLIGESRNTPWKWVLQVPLTEYMRYGNMLKGRVILVSVLVFVVMAAFSVAVINRLTSPFSAMLERARNLRAGKYDRRGGDMRFVADTFEEYVNYAELARRQLDERQELMQRSFLLAVLLGRTLTEREILHGGQMMEPVCSHASYWAIMLRRETGVFSLREEQWIEGAMKAREGEESRFFSAGAYGGVLYAAVNSDEEEKVRAALFEAADEFLQAEGVRVDVLIGSAVDRLERVGESLREIREKADEESLPEHEQIDEEQTQPVLEDGCAEKAARYLQEHYREDVAVQDVADALNVSRSHLSREFKERHGMTILEYLMGVRLSSALRMLDETSLSVTEISELSGFNNSNYFFKKFKEKFGQTPMQYRTEKK